MLILLVFFAASASIMSGCVLNKDKKITSLDQLNQEGRVIGVPSDTADYKLVEEKFPKAEIRYFSGEESAYPAVSQGKLDAFVFNKLTMEIAVHNGLKGVRVMDEDLGEVNKSAVALSPKTKIPDLEDKVNEFIEKSEKDGTIAEMQKRWLEDYDYTMPEIKPARDTKLHLVVGTTGINTPFTFYKGTELIGYDIELAERFAAWLGASIEFKIYDYEGVIAAAQSGDVDCVFTNLFITPEREQAIRFSRPTFTGVVGVMIRDTGDNKEEQPEYTKLTDFKGKRIGVVTGAIQDPLVREQIPDAEILYFNNQVDMLTAMKHDKIDAYALPELLIRYMMIENEELTYLNVPLNEPVKTGAAFAKTERGDKLRAEFNEFIKEINDDGSIKEIHEIWLGRDDERKKAIDASELPATNGTITLALDTATPPAVYILDNHLAGIDYDIISRFCKSRGYGLEISDMAFSSVINAVSSGKMDMSIGSIAITEERKESVNFSDTIYEGASVMAYLDKSKEKSGSLFGSLKESSEKTFIKEGRWKLFLSGIGTTLMITILSILFGTIIGFLVYMICRNGNRPANLITRFFVWLINGMPVVVLLMILYYVVFGKAQASGAAISIVGFTMIFAASVYGMLNAGVAAVGVGQTEAAYALGYTNNGAFFRVVLPQALPHFMPAYKKQITALIKATAVVGYVAVQDLTKMGDIVRSRTYEAFFPLVAVAIMYFVLAGVLTFCVNKIELKVDPRQRKPEDILKEVTKND